MKRIQYSFKNIALLKQALTHRSVARENNERLEFLGDALLTAVITSTLFHQFPQHHEGELTRMRAYLVKEESLASIACDINLGNYLALGPGELKTGGYRRASILADALEALIAAVFLDSDFSTTATFIHRLVESRLNDTSALQNTKDAKTQLQEYLQANKQTLPHYTLLSHDETKTVPVFTVNCELSSLHLNATGVGETRRKAEQEAASHLLARLKIKGKP